MRSCSVVGVGNAGRVVVDPVGLDVEQRIAGTARFRQLQRGARLALRIAQGYMLQAVGQGIAHAARGEERVGTDIAQAPPGDRFLEIVVFEIVAADRDPARRRYEQAGEHFTDRFRAAVDQPDDRRAGRHGHLERGMRHQCRAGVVGNPQVAGRDRAGDRRHGFHDGLVNARLDHVVGIELFDHLRVFDLNVQPFLIPVDQLPDRRRQILIGGNDGDQLTDVQIARDRQVPAQEVEQERRELRHEVVQELDEELALIELVANEEDAAQTAGDVRALVVRRVVDVDFGNAVDDLADPARQIPGLALALPGQFQKLAPHPRDDDGLAEHDRKRDGAEHDVLVENEHHGDRRKTALEDRRDIGIADELAERLDLVLDHGRHFGRPDPAEIGLREP